MDSLFQSYPSFNLSHSLKHVFIATALRYVILFLFFSPSLFYITHCCSFIPISQVPCCWSITTNGLFTMVDKKKKKKKDFVFPPGTEEPAEQTEQV